MNKNARKDARWDALRNLGNCNQYNRGSASWRAYESTYHRTMSAIASRSKSSGSSIRLPA